jgi:large subunit ribosomal protein L22
MSGTIDLTEIAGARATHKYARLSASKVRVVLNLIRDEDVHRAADILQFTDRGAAEVIAKVLKSAVANATSNDGLDADELYVAECFADEGPTLKRWRPRARGRATRINKRTCHITVIVARLDDEELEAREASGSQASRGGADRSARVAASRAASDDDNIEDIVTDIETAAEDFSNDAIEAIEAVTEEVSPVDDAGDDAAAAAPYGEGSAAPLEDDSAPEGYDIKGNADSMKYHEADGRWYDATVAEVWFNSVEAAESAGFIKAGTRAKAADAEDADKDEEA